jgi:hypothetical protein
MKATRKIKKPATPSKRPAARTASHSAWKSKTGSERSTSKTKAAALIRPRVNLACDGR